MLWVSARVVVSSIIPPARGDLVSVLPYSYSLFVLTGLLSPYAMLLWCALYLCVSIILWVHVSMLTYPYPMNFDFTMYMYSQVSCVRGCDHKSSFLVEVEELRMQ